MILLDAFPLIAYLNDEPAADEVEALLRGGPCVISSVNLAEALDNLLRVQRLSAEEVAEVVNPLLAGTLEVRSADGGIAWGAAEVRDRHYRRRTSALSLADCVLLASAASDDRIATADPAVATVARSEAMDLIALPDSRGNRP